VKKRFNKTELRAAAKQIAADKSLLNVGRCAVQNVLIQWRDSGICALNRGNGLVIKERCGHHSDLIRFGFEVGFRIALKAIAEGKTAATLEAECDDYEASRIPDEAESDACRLGAEGRDK